MHIFLKNGGCLQIYEESSIVAVQMGYDVCAIKFYI